MPSTQRVWTLHQTDKSHIFILNFIESVEKKKQPSSEKVSKKFYFCLQRFWHFIYSCKCVVFRQMEMVHNGSALFIAVVVIGQTSTFNNMHDSKTIRFRLLTLLLFSLLYRIKFRCHFVLLLVFADVTGKSPNDFCFQQLHFGC